MKSNKPTEAPAFPKCEVSFIDTATREEDGRKVRVVEIGFDDAPQFSISGYRMRAALPIPCPWHVVEAITNALKAATSGDMPVFPMPAMDAAVEADSTSDEAE